MSQSSLVNKHNESLILSTDVVTQYAQVVCNPDGSNVGASVTVTADTEFSAAAALSDNFANPTTTSVFALGGVWDGATWDRAPGNSADGLLVNLGANNDVTVTGNVAHDAADSGNPTKIGGRAVDPTSLPSAVAANDRSDIYTSLQGEVLVYNTRLNFGEDQTNNLQGVLPKPIAGSTYTGTSGQNNSFQTANVKASAGNLLKASVINTTGTARYFQIHNTATTPVGGATAANKWLVPANSQLILGPAELGDAGLYHATGLAIANSITASTYTAGASGDLLVEYTTI